MIKILCIGKMKDKALQALSSEYVRRISAFTRVEIIEVKDEGDIDSFFGSGQTTFLSGGFSGLDDFELICFMVVI